MGKKKATALEFSMFDPAPMPPSIHLPRGHKASRFRGCLLGGAVGDALGAPVEFLSLREIIARFGPSGISDYFPAYRRRGAITDDTQMTLFTAEGMLRAHVRSQLKGIGPVFSSVVPHAYRRWLYTQGFTHPALSLDDQGWLITHSELFAGRASGVTCMSSLQKQRNFGDRADNKSKGCGGVMRVAPVGMFMANWIQRSNEDAVLSECFTIACDVAAITHGHPTGQLSAGVFASVIALVLVGRSLSQALDRAKSELRRCPDHEETLQATERAEELARSRPASRDALQLLGEGWTAEEALAIGLYCALSAMTFKSGVLLAVNHSGDSDSTGAIAGSLLGAAHGLSAIPSEWLDGLELRPVIREMADDLATVRKWELLSCEDSAETDYYWNKYPGW